MRVFFSYFSAVIIFFAVCPVYLFGIPFVVHAQNIPVPFSKEFLEKTLEIQESSSQTELPNTVNCFDHYRFGSVKVNIDSEIKSAVSGTTFTISGTLDNENEYPIVDGAVYVKVFKKEIDKRKVQVNGHSIVDQFIALDTISLAPLEKKPISIEWQVPAHALSGDYQIATYFISAKKFNLLGLSFTDDVVGNTVNFSVLGDVRGAVSFDKYSVKTGKLKHYFISPIPRVSATDPVTVSANIINSTPTTQDVSLMWTLYYWDGVNEKNIIERKEEVVSIQSNKTRNVTYTVNDTAHSVYYLTAQITYKDTSSFLNVRFARIGKDELRINFPAISTFPIIKGTETTLFSCLHNGGFSDVVEGGKLELSLQTEDGKTIHSYTYEGGVTGLMMGVKDDFIPKKSYDNLVLVANLYQAGVLVDSVKINYDCAQIDPSGCLQNTSEYSLERNTTIMVIVSLIIIAILLLIFRKGWRNH